VSIRESILNNVREGDPDLWNTLVHHGLTEKIADLSIAAYETGVSAGTLGASPDEPMENVLTRTCDAFALAYAEFCVWQMKTLGDEIPPEYNSIQGQLEAAKRQALPNFLGNFVRHLAAFGVKPRTGPVIQVAQEVPPVQPPQEVRRLILS
jgi:hypothetical protein